MSLIDKFRTVIHQPRSSALRVNRVFADVVLERLRPPTDVFEEDWDNLLILDACRHDMLGPEDVPEGRLEHRWSGGSKSVEFLEFHLSDQVLDDVVWVTANPWVSRYRDKIFEVIDLWDSGWDNNLETVPPEEMHRAALEAEERYPDKRLVVHFMQPHYPFIGEFGRSKIPDHRHFTGEGMIDHDGSEESIWDYLEAGIKDLNRDDVWRAYMENLGLVLPEAKKLQRELIGKTVLTSDHGNELGGYGFPIPIRLYGHTGGLRTKNLTRVPWVVFDAETRKSITHSDGTFDDSAAEGSRDRLKALGYAEQ